MRMNLGFWEKVKVQRGADPIIVLAPMADVTDVAFRRLIAKYSEMGTPSGGPDVMWTEFVSADGLVHPKAREKLLIDLGYSEGERPIVAQLFTSNPANMKEAAALCRELGFDGIDINMGCPDRSIEKQGCGAALIKNPVLARSLIRAAKEGAGDVPVSVKTRIGYNKNELSTWLPELLAEEPAVVTIHARTRKELSLVPARWEHVREAVEIRNRLGSKTLILGNGDVQDLEDAREKTKASGSDGAMIGRGIFGNPWRFHRTKKIEHISIPERLLVMVEHTKLFEELLGGKKNFAIMKKHYKAYVNGWPEAKELRVKLMEAPDAATVEAMVQEYINTL